MEKCTLFGAQNLPATVHSHYRLRVRWNVRDYQARRQAGGAQFRPATDGGGLQVRVVAVYIRGFHVLEGDFCPDQHAPTLICTPCKPP